MTARSPDGLAARQIELRMAARALGRHGLVHAYGHCSLRLDAERFLVCAPRPMGLIAPGEAGTVVDVHGPLPEGVLGEVRIHQQIYQRRPDVHGIVRSMPPRLMALGTGEGLVSPAMQKIREASMHSTVPPNSPALAYALGFGVFNGWIGHTGELPGFNTSILYDPRTQTTVVSMVNSDIAALVGTKAADPAPTISAALIAALG